ncbi:hypothetical protein A33Q_3067 [Indibacter alkaliphilus LW1]|uniref:DUF1015 domain-containing protein n=1 Tax=Indibacter alkaliphilus (strain CCUG 57479 / KCTC 22604 / LW1) TaxID=1189612 RepID=S2DF83_INDAL|nr:DUF1015 domain-containing protein [Indibacter alkaliphilus]EOZ95705.1 hypothetical protein A33Q_3067 [Indibacter alkaliphilus LW1]
MAEILPIKAWRYHDNLGRKIEELTSPLFDVVSQKQREALYSNPINSIHLSVPLGPDPVQNASRTLENWKDKEILKQDDLPGIYVYYQYFKFPGQEEESCRKGFIAQIRAYDWDEKVVLRHENTIAKAVNDRIDLLRATQIQSSPTHGLYEDPLHELEPYMDEAIEDPIYDLEDYQGVREVLAVIHDANIISKFLKVLESKHVILADGHHRYEGAIAFRKEMTGKNPDHTGQEGYNYHMMYFTNALSKNLRILPTHRLFLNIDLAEGEILQKLEPWFIIKKLNDVEEISELILQRKWAFGLIFSENAYKIRLIPEKIHEMQLSIPEVVKEVDMMVLHYFFIDKVLGVPLDKQRFSDKIEYERNLRRCLGKVEKGIASFAVITKDVAMTQVLDVCKSGFTMPQKSTYFYPKTLSGLIFASVAEEDFAFPYQAFKG